MTQPSNLKGMPRPYAVAKALGVIEARIAPLVEAMNQIPLIQTIASCEGHRGWFFLYLPPYVAFNSTVDMAGAIEKALRSCDDPISSLSLNYYWHVTGSFNEHGELRFVLTIPGINSRHPIKATRAKVDRDIQRIIELLPKAYELLPDVIEQVNHYLKSVLESVELTRN